MAHGDLYEVLGVARTASPSEIRKAYHKLAKEVHPDKQGGDTVKFQELNHAHDILSDAEKRSLYDKYGEEGLERGASGSASDLFSSMFGSAASKPQKQKTKDTVHVLPVTLEQLYTGKTKKMAVNRDVVDKKSGVKQCAACNGQGSTVQPVQQGPFLMQTSAPCSACEATGHIFKTKRSREVLEVHVQRGAVDGQKITFSEKSDELPGADTGDVVFVLKEQKHAVFKRRGADLYIERTISLVEALCGFELEVTHLDGRKLLIKTAPGEVVKPMQRGFDPFASEAGMVWESIEGADCPSIDTVAEAHTTDVDMLKQACETQLKRRGVDVAAFVVSKGCAYFKSGTRHDILDAQKPNPNCAMYVVADPSASSQLRMMKAVKDEGMPTVKNPFVCGNLFLILNIEFPQSLSSDALEQLPALLPSPLHAHRPGSSKSSAAPDGETSKASDLEHSPDVEISRESAGSHAPDEEMEVHELVDMDPVQSYNSNQANMTTGGEAYDEDEESRRMPGQQCAQM